MCQFILEKVGEHVLPAHQINLKMTAVDSSGLGLRLRPRRGPRAPSRSRKGGLFPPGAQSSEAVQKREAWKRGAGCKKQTRKRMLQVSLSMVFAQARGCAGLWCATMSRRVLFLLALIESCCGSQAVYRAHQDYGMSLHYGSKASMFVQKKLKHN